MSIMIYPNAFISYLIEFHATRDYFECHELLEEYWKEHPDDGLSDFWVGHIQVAVGQYHERRGNFRGARLMYESAIVKLSNYAPIMLGLDLMELISQLEQHITACEEKSAYEDIQIDIVDTHLLALCKEATLQRGLEWGMSSKQVNDDVIHRHKLRDRSDVITARHEALQNKRQSSQD